MHALSPEVLASYWSANEIATNLVVFMNLVGALLLGFILGYERSYHGRAAGMRTYGLVCVASCACTVIAGYPASWYGGAALLQTGGAAVPMPDPTRVIQGIVTGVGFLGAGVIMKEGLNISGLTTAASIWSASVIGILVGIGFYGAAILLTLLSAACMLYVSRLEAWLPSRHAISVSLRFLPEFMPQEIHIRKALLDMGYEVAGGSFSVGYQGRAQEWRFVAVALGQSIGKPLAEMPVKLIGLDGVDSFNVAHARN
ncbi:MgtC/SapB family protein [Ferribacterium limneticum]|uniref:MgtC/SapB family protein n=1 Tax=Ferribacterium limneticum TaxID=76259 RepID=UPI001CF83CF3|nr:MgtC/SapB family protein [Ferribacterium limneticum]UCV23454.1 MgtC/SapB family protein [Ferribacterium limneticum]